jgi:N-acetylglucosaminyldiphosphoundecaprenol N-acetyl-beta-D-mannosaminyltransferase
LRHFSVLGVRVVDTYRPVALQMMHGLMRAPDRRCRSVFFVNAHTLNVAADEPDFRRVLESADVVLNDGTGVRWAARQRGITLRDNLNGTDLIPAFFAATRGRGHRFFLLGAARETIGDAAEFARRQFQGWELAGYHHGYVHDDGDRVVDQINAARPDLLLVGMGNPLQERWIHRHQPHLKVPLAVGVGGLFDYWGGKLERAPHWVRKWGSEWVHLLLRQPHKCRRYLVGNPKFLYRMTRALKEDLARMRAADTDGTATNAIAGTIRRDLEILEVMSKES